MCAKQLQAEKHYLPNFNKDLEFITANNLSVLGLHRLECPIKFHHLNLAEI